jgi:hypothetical protein
MSTKRIEERLKSSVRKRGVAKLSGHKIRFNKRSIDGSGKTSIVVAAGDEVWGVLFDLTQSQYDALTSQEKDYKEQVVTVQLGGDDLQAKAFVAEKTEDHLKPTPVYLKYLIAGAREHQLPTEYIKMLEATKVAPSRKGKRSE